MRARLASANGLLSADWRGLSCIIASLDRGPELVGVSNGSSLSMEEYNLYAEEKGNPEVNPLKQGLTKHCI